MASPLVGIRAVGLLAHSLERRRAARRSRPDGARVGNVHLDCRPRWSSDRMVALGLPRLSPSADLPQFVEHIHDANYKLGLRGTIRMETPVLYFYSPRDVTVSARVSFSKGLITEWYPHADSVQPGGVVTNTSLSQLPSDGSITWNHVTVSPNLAGELPQRGAVEPLLRCSRDRFLATPRTDQCGGAAREIPLLSGSFRRFLADFS